MTDVEDLKLKAEIDDIMKSVENIMQKADTKLELAAINSLRQWRFEPLPQSQNVTEQYAVIIFPFRLR